MPLNLMTFIGFSSLLAWLQASSQLCLARDAIVHNGSPAACALFVISLLLYGLLNRLLAIEPHRGFLLGCALLASALGIAYAFSDMPGVRLLLFCLQGACAALFVISWGERLTSFTYRALVPLVCAAGLCSTVVLALFAALPSASALLSLSVLPACSGICLFLATGTIARGETGQSLPAEHAASNGYLSLEPLDFEALKRLPWTLLAVLCLCTFAASLFSGMVTSPYLINSSTVGTSMADITVAGLLLVGLGGWLFFLKGGIKDRNPEESPPGSMPSAEASANGKQTRDPAFFIQLMTGIFLILLVAGLLLFSMKLPGTMTTSLSMMLGARNCLTILCWIVFPRAVADARLPFIPCFSLLALASGTLYAPYLGVGISKTTSLGFDALTSTATALIAFVAVLAILYMVLRMRQIGAGQRMAATAPASAEPLTMEDIRSALRNHRLKMMEPYGLTERERQIVTLIVDGQTLGGIAEDLFISERTVKFHSKNAYDKLGVRSKKELMQMFSEL